MVVYIVLYSYVARNGHPVSEIMGCYTERSDARARLAYLKDLVNTLTPREGAYPQHQIVSRNVTFPPTPAHPEHTEPLDLSSDDGV